MATIAYTTTLRTQVEDLVGKVLSGQLLEAYDTYYAEGVEMQENTHPPTIGRAANRVREEQFLASVAEFHSAEAPSILVDGDQAVIHWVLEFTNIAGERVRLDQLAHQVWRDGQVVRERFFYDTGAAQ